ncbi:E3 ubiquitin-protein ligase DTX3L-like [Astyanax mexicanus]|uniref:E3 ubiquitin-protein ligase DTX3L-like n=1 Tax=Astyanax mexicanus TaxID=7994 RepID=UPI0020CAE82F|nr:E3 ubiquitin-protein ligase DTX3L-like [Astyanax mexicanus]
MFVNAVIDLDKWPKEVQTELRKRMGKYQAGNKLSFSGSLAEAERFYREVCEIVEGSEAGMNTGAVRNDSIVEISGPSVALPALITPLHHYWYFSQAYKKEINQIQDKFGVKIDAEVSVSVTAEDQTRPDSVRKAKDKLMDLYQTSTTSLQSLTIPQTQLDSDIAKNVVRNIQSDEAKMVLMMSVDGCRLFGSKNTVSGVQSRLNSEDSGEVASRQTSRTSELKTDPILMNETHWRVMKKRFEKHLLNIEQKYGVQFCDEHSHGSAKVTIQSRDNQPVNQESHALKDFMQLYLEVVLSAVSVPDQERTVVEALERHRLVGVEDKNAEQSDPAYQSMDRDPGFDDEPKTLISTENLPFPKQPEVTASLIRPETVQRTNDNQRHKNSKQKESNKSKYKDDCPICMESFSDLVKLKCGHRLCRVCQKRAAKSMGEICPVCKRSYGMLTGNQPEGEMKYSTLRYDLPGYPRCGTIEIIYDIPSGIQTDEHPNPGHPYSGIKCRAYLPDSPEGRQVLHLLIRAFDQRLIFTVGKSTTTGAQNTVIWNDIHHKTNTTGGPEGNGYPDSNYMKRVKEELKAKGIEFPV